MLHMLLEVVIGTIGDPFELIPSPGELVLDVVATLGIVGQLTVFVARARNFPGWLANFRRNSCSSSRTQTTRPQCGLTEKLHFHLLKLAGAEVLGRDFIARIYLSERFRTGSSSPSTAGYLRTEQTSPGLFPVADTPCCLPCMHSV